MQLSVDVDSAVPDKLFGDSTRLIQILTNLVGNAIKFTDKGWIKIIASIDNELDDGKISILFQVMDTGIGITDKQKENVFNSFTQADGSITRQFGGTGLGLSISLQLVEMMGGEIWIDSPVPTHKKNNRYGPGTSMNFTVCLKKVKSDFESSESPIYSSEKMDQIIKRDEPFHALLVEDEVINRMLLSALLEQKNIKVTVAENGQEALEKLQKNNFDLIVMDLQMPVMDGLQATLKIRKKELGTDQKIPIIAITARAMQQDKEKCFAAGMDGYVSKPINQEKFFQQIEKCLTR